MDFPIEWIFAGVSGTLSHTADSISSDALELNNICLLVALPPSGISESRAHLIKKT